MPNMNFKLIKKTILFFFLIAFIFANFSLGVYYGKLTAPLPSPDVPAGVDFSVLWDTWRNLEKEYLGELDEQKMIYGAAAGLANSLGDPYTVFFNPKETKLFEDDIAGKFGGVGMEVGIKDGSLTVIAPLEGTPAKAAGLRPGDRILKVDGVSVEGMAIGEAVLLIRGEKGTKVTLTMSRKEGEEEIVKDFEIIRDEISIPCVKLDFISSEDNDNKDIAHIKLYQFSQNLDIEFNKIALEILNSPAKKIILDMRGNPGGLLGKVEDVSGYFLKRGDIVTIESRGGGKTEREYRASGNEMFLDYPVVVLMDKGSASGAEILAAALRDNLGVKLIGEKSFGKGSVQKPISLREGASLKVTIAHWMTPLRKQINKVGLEPDIKVAMTEQDYKEKKDPQLDKAIEIIKEMK